MLKIQGDVRMKKSSSIFVGVVFLVVVSHLVLSRCQSATATVAPQQGVIVSTEVSESKVIIEESKDSSEVDSTQHFWNCGYELELQSELEQDEEEETTELKTVGTEKEALSPHSLTEEGTTLEDGAEDASEDASEESSNVTQTVEDDGMDWSLQYGEDEFEGLLFLAYSEVGGQDVQEDHELICAVVHSILNSCKAREISPLEEAFRTQGAYANADSCNQQIYCGEGLVTRDLISPEFESICWDCWTGAIDSPIGDYYCFMSPELMGYESCPISWFAEDFGIEDYIQIGNGIFFPEECYTAKLQEYIENGYSWE